uniref:hypothetical protein n=1 Tax=Halomonas sp. TaxID=1486246 RepID=UPI00260C19D7|nr:hypothetical protein [Halomonas sp.]
MMPSITTHSLKGGRLAQAAAMLCQDPGFRLYLDHRKRHKLGLCISQLPDGTHSEQDAREWLCAACNIQSRAELDHHPQVAATFHAIRSRFRRWYLRQRPRSA